MLPLLSRVVDVVVQAFTHSPPFSLRLKQLVVRWVVPPDYRHLWLWRMAQ